MGVEGGVRWVWRGRKVFKSRQLLVLKGARSGDYPIRGVLKNVFKDFKV